MKNDNVKDKILNNKAQIGFFILIGLVVVVIIILFTIVQFSVSSRMKQDVISKGSAELNIEIVDDYIESCVSEALASGLVKLGESGGYVYDYNINQKGNIINLNIANKNIDVPYAIKVAGTPAPYYPNYQRVEQRKNITWENPHLIGEVSLVSLNQMKDSLHHYVLNYTIDCVNLSIFDEAGIKVIPQRDLSLSDVVLSYGSTDVTLNVDWPMRIISSLNTSTISGSYVVKEQVRLNRLYELISDELENERLYFSNEIGKNTSRDSNSLSIINYVNRGDSDSNKYDNILVFIDSKSKIKGRPYFFYIAMSNRLPALNYMGEQQTQQYFVDGNIYDYIVLSGSEINFELDAKDPDDDYLVNSDLALKYDFECCNNNCENHIDLTSLRQTNSTTIYTLSGEDSTDYCLKISVEDEQGLFDFQEIKLLAVKQPAISLNFDGCSNNGQIISLDPGEFPEKFSVGIDSEFVDRFNIDVHCDNILIYSKDNQYKDIDMPEVLNSIRNRCDRDDDLKITIDPISSGVSIGEKEFPFTMTDYCD